MHDEGEGVAFGHGLVGLLSVEWLDQDGVFIELGGEFKG